MRHFTLQEIERLREREAIRATIEARIAELIEQLDEIDGDPDEPVLGAPERHPHADSWWSIENGPSTDAGL